jgi:hypothetical protein
MPSSPVDMISVAFGSKDIEHDAWILYFETKDGRRRVLGGVSSKAAGDQGVGRVADRGQALELHSECLRCGWYPLTRQELEHHIGWPLDDTTITDFEALRAAAVRWRWWSACKKRVWDFVCHVAEGRV